MNYKILASGSSGNSTIIEDIILVDCGLSFKELENYLNQVKLILLTHQHSDHFNIRTVAKISKEYPKIRFGCGKFLYSDLVRCGVSRKQIDILNIECWYRYKNFTVNPIELFHDVPNQGYKIEFKDIKYIYATDTNSMKNISATNYDVFLVEGNYDKKQLEKELKESKQNGEFNYRTRVPKTHLSKEQCLDFFFKNAKETSVLEFMHEHKEK